MDRGLVAKGGALVGRAVKPRVPAEGKARAKARARDRARDRVEVRRDTWPQKEIGAPTIPF